MSRALLISCQGTYENSRRGEEELSMVHDLLVNKLNYDPHNILVLSNDQQICSYYPKSYVPFIQPTPLNILSSVQWVFESSN